MSRCCFPFVGRLPPYCVAGPPLSPHAAAVHGPAAQRFKFEEIQPHSPRSRACQPASPLAILVAIVSTTATFHPVMPYVAGS